MCCYLKVKGFCLGFVFVCDRVSLYSQSRRPKTHYEDEAGQTHRDLLATASQVLGLKGLHHQAQLKKANYSGLPGTDNSAFEQQPTGHKARSILAGLAGTVPGIVFLYMFFSY